MAFSTTDLFLSPLQQLVRSLGRKTSIREKLSDQTLRILSKMHIGGKLLQIFLGLRIFVKVQYDIFKILSPKNISRSLPPKLHTSRKFVEYVLRNGTRVTYSNTPMKLATFIRKLDLGIYCRNSPMKLVIFVKGN